VVTGVAGPAALCDREVGDWRRERKEAILRWSTRPVGRSGDRTGYCCAVVLYGGVVVVVVSK
jgi:hypothetical protein